MSSNTNDTINLGNYEEWFILYMDDELGTEDKRMVDNFLLLHPQLQEEMDVLLSTKLPADGITFAGKEELKAEAMKLNAVDENLLLYLDNELPAAGKKAVEERLAADQDYRLQHALLQQTRLDASEVILHPNKKELYRHTEAVIFFPLWLRIAAVVVLILFAAFFFVFTTNQQPANGYAIQVNKPLPLPENRLPGNQPAENSLPLQQQTATVNTARKDRPVIRPDVKQAVQVVDKKKTIEPITPADQQVEMTALQEAPAVHIEAAKLNAQPAMAINIPVATPAVTSATPATYKDQSNPEITAGIEGDDRSNRTPAKGFLRKVSRFLERRTGIGTVNADNELLVGAVALKLN
ncbi:anti-sigma factor family protein [Flavisolibacter nicotianae]|uniref:anti-sigma factor family protein n=1 Tax=Flavisolibacter nicotianae TaxID=2364882 RepID=UPI000EAE4F04|nr:hypothetical protein [Flavisolibacter nicotianae]